LTTEGQVVRALVCLKTMGADRAARVVRAGWRCLQQYASLLPCASACRQRSRYAGLGCALDRPRPIAVGS